MTSESMVLGRRNSVLAAVIGTVLASYAGSATALEFEFDNGGRLNWNTTLSVGASWRAEDPARRLYTRADGSALGLYNAPLIPGTYVGPDDGLAGNHAAGDGNLNYAKGDRFTTPFKLITDLEYKKDRWGGLVRVKAWYDQALNEEKVRYGSQANEYNGVRKGLGPVPGYRPCNPTESANWNGSLNCMPVSPPGQNLWPQAKLSDKGFEAEQKFDNVYLLDAYVYGSFDIGETDLQLRLGRQVINWGESIFIQGVNQTNPIDVPAARRAGAELKEILLPVEMLYFNWGLPFGSLEAFYQLKWDNTSVDACGTYFTSTSTLVGSDPGSCRSLTVFGAAIGTSVAGVVNPHLSAQPYQVSAAGSYIPAVKGQDASDSGQFGVAFRFPVDAIDTEIGLYAMNIHSRLPFTRSVNGTNPRDIPQPYRSALQAQGLIGSDAWGWFYKVPTSTTLFRSLIPTLEGTYEGIIRQAGGNVDLQTAKGGWVYPEDIQIYGISAATNLFGWSTSAEVSFQKDVPAQVNGNDLLGAGISGIGPYREEASRVAALGEGAFLLGYDLFDKTQAQLNFVKTYSNYLGADNIVLVGEVGGQWNDVPNYKKGGVRYGRGFMYGTGSGPEYAPGGFAQGQPTIPLINGNWCSPTLVGAPIPIANTSFNPHPEGCRNDGYVTDMAWGYRLRASLSYNNVFSTGIGVTPSVFWSDDVNGVSMDPTFNEGRSTLGLGLKFDLAKKYVLDFNYVSYANKTFDPLFDRDYYSASFSVTF